MKHKIKKIKKQHTVQTKLPLKETKRYYSFGFLVGEYNT